MKQLPKISIVIITLNNKRTIEECVRRIISQDYPKNLIEYLNVDGGSIDSTRSIMKHHGFNVVNSFIKKNAEAQRAIGLKLAKNNLIVSLDADNYLPDNAWLKKMVKPFMEDTKIVHAGTLHYTYRKNDSLFNRYCSLFGVVDPVVYYIGKPDRLPQNVKTWSRGNVIKETNDYYVVEFTKDTLPTVGCNGVVYKRDILLKHAKSKPSEFLHIDVFADLLENGFNRFAVVKNDVIHNTAVDLGFLIKKRISFLSDYYLNKNIKRRYLIYNPKKIYDAFKLLLFFVYTITFLKPLADSMRGYISIRDRAWFFHPVMCWIYLYTYGVATIKRFSVISLKLR